jgi:hypothetical protein
MRSVPLVVWPVARLEPGSSTADRSRQRWQILRERGKALFTSVSCQLTYGFEEFSDWLDADDELCALAYASDPDEEWLEAAWVNGVPVMVWSRRDCGDKSGGHEAHMEVCRQITEQLSATDPDRLPVEVLRLRKAARSPDGGGEGHCGRNLTLYWDDLARMPDPSLAYGGD